MTSPVPTETRRGRLRSRILVITLIALFLISVVGFAVAVISAKPSGESAAPASAPTSRVVNVIDDVFLREVTIALGASLDR